MQAELIRTEQVTDRVKRMFFKWKNRDNFIFSAGQFVTLKFPQLPEFENTRSYSLASDPNNNSEIELCISLNPQGNATPILWNMKPGDVQEMSEPQGDFVLRETEGKDVAFICTGTGVAPFRSMIFELIPKLIANQKVYLIFGNRWKHDLLYDEEFKKLAAVNGQFIYIPVLSREQHWLGKKGYVHAVYQQLFGDGHDAWFYVCGWQNMCREARQHLKNLGYNRRQYFFEQYD